jgi:XTP/dITP diphosphohydrolase
MMWRSKKKNWGFNAAPSFFAKIGSETKILTLQMSVMKLWKKLIHRHHIYSDTVVKDEEEVKQNWEKLKLKKEKNISTRSARSLPALVKASRIQDKVKE